MSLKTKTNKQVIDLINEGTCTLSTPQKNQVTRILQEHGYGGEDLVNAKTEEGLRGMGFSFAATPLQQWIAKWESKNKPSVKDLVQASILKRQMAGNGNGNGNSFPIHYCKGSNKYLSKNKFTMSTTISEFIHVLATNELGISVEKTYVVIMGHIYHHQSKETFEKIGFNKKFEVTFSQKVEGGMAAMADDEKENNRERYPNWENNKFEATLDEDCLLFDKDDNLRVKMPCGHVFGPQCIFEIIQSYAQDGGATGVSCPMPDCGKEWEFGMLIDAADLNASEISRFTTIFDNRKASEKADIRICKGCSNVLIRPDNVLNTRVRCTAKDCPLKSDFCWVCGGKWQGGGFTVCGNKGCLMEKINHVLQTCEEKVLVKESANYTKKCPVIRACPRCLTLVNYDTSCKHMRCWGCQKRFCFYCLSLESDNGSWPCNGYGYQCEPKPRQSLK